LAFVRIANLPELIERFQQTAMGRLSGDQQVKPLVSQLYGSAVDAYRQVEDRIGLPLDKLLAIPQGEICVAVVPPEEGRPEVLVLFEVGDRYVEAQMLLERLKELVLSQGGECTSERMGDVEMTLFDSRGRTLAVCEKDQVIVAGTDLALVKQMLTVWNGSQDVLTLADNQDYATIMNRCRGDREDPPQITWFVDPIALAARAGRGNLSAAAGMAVVSGLGLDGLAAAGGSVTMATGEFDGIMENHLLLDAPRDGVLKMLALESGTTTPEPWVPRDVASYATLHWDLPQTYAELERLFDQFRGEDAWNEQVVQGLNDRFEVDFEKDVLQELEGRITYVTWMEKPPRLNSQTTLVALKVKDPSAARRTLNRIVQRLGQRLKEETYGGMDYYRAEGGQRPRRFDAATMRLPEPCIAVMDDYFVFTDSVKLLQQLVITKSDPTQSLARELDFKLIASKIGREGGDQKAALISFSRPEEALRHLYEMASSPSMRDRLQDAGQNNPFLLALSNALNDNPLPPFAVVAQYLAPGGALVTNDQTGFHHISFTLRRE
jgi:hypothetical protein